MKPDIIKAMQHMGVKMVDSIANLLKEIDFVLLESNERSDEYHNTDWKNKSL